MKLQSVATIAIASNDGRGVVFDVTSQVARLIIWFLANQSLHLSAIILFEASLIVANYINGWRLDLSLIIFAIFLLAHEGWFHEENVQDASGGH